MPERFLPRMKGSLFNTEVSSGSANVMFATALQTNFSPAKFRIQLAMNSNVSMLVKVVNLSTSVSATWLLSTKSISQVAIVDHMVREGFSYNYFFLNSTTVYDLQIMEIPADSPGMGT